MKKIWTCSAGVLMTLTLAQLPAFAGDDDEGNTIGTRYSLEADRKMSRGFHLFAGEEMRLKDGFSSVDRFHTTAGASFKINDFLKAGVMYTLITVRKDDDLGEKFWDWRHRGSFDVTGTWKPGLWRLSLRERFQATFKTRDVNEYQQPQTALALRSRLKVSRKFPGSKLEPYAACELRLVLNGPKWDANSTDAVQYAVSEYSGHSDVYSDRLRSRVGLEWSLGKHHSLDFYCIYDRFKDKNIDSRKEPVLKMPVTTSHASYLAFCAGWRFEF